MNEKIKKYDFFTPTKKLREYLLLESLDTKEVTSQRELALDAGISPSVANNYISEFENQGLVNRQSLNNRDYRYLLSEKGRRRKRELMVKYIRETFQMFSEGKKELGEKLKEHKCVGNYETAVFYSAGEVTELLLHSIDDIQLTLKAIVDDDEGKQGKKLYGYPIISRNEIEDLEPDVVIITTFQYRETIREKLDHLENKNFDVIGF